MIRAKQFKLPLEENLLNNILNADYPIYEKKIFQDRAGDVVIYLEWEQEDDREQPGHT